MVVKIEKARQELFKTVNGMLNMGIPAVAVELILNEILLDLSKAQTTELVNTVIELRKEKKDENRPESK